MIEVKNTNVIEISIKEPVLSVNNASEILPLLKQAVDMNMNNVELNLDMVKSVDSTAIATLVKFVQYLSGTKRSVTLTNVSPDIIKVLDILNLTRFFKIWGRKPPLA